MAADAANGAPTVGGRPAWQKWALIGGVAILAYYLYTRYEANQANTAATGTSGSGTTTSPTVGSSSIDPTTGQPITSFAVDPNTGVPINPATGQDFGLTQIGSASSALGAWVTNAYAAATGNGVDATLANQTLYDYTNGNPLTTAEQGVLDTIFGKVGQAPGNLLPSGNGTVTTTTSSTAGITGAPGPNPGGVTEPALTAVQNFVNNVYKNIRAGTVKTPANEAIAENYVKSGAAYLPSGFTAPAGYQLNPSTRILTKAA